MSDDVRTKNSFRPLPSLALAALAAWVGERHEVAAVDLNMAAYEAPGRMAGASELAVEMDRAIRTARYDWLCLSSMFAYNVRWLQDAITQSKRYHPEARIVMGGGLATLFPEEAHRLGVDNLICGEGEVRLGHLIDGKSYGRTDWTIVDLGALPPPAWGLLDVKGCWARGADRTLPIEASRGCPYNCSYCTVTGTWGPRVRYKDIDQVLHEIELAVDVHGAEKLHFVDDNLAFDRRWFKGFLRAFIGRGIKVQLDASNFSVIHLDEELAGLLVKAGFERVCVAVESGSRVIQERIRKRIDLACIEGRVRMLQRAGLWVHLCWMVGFPGETREQILETLALVERLRAESNQILTVVPYPGTDLHSEAKAAGMLVGDIPLDRLDCRQAELLVNQEWDYPWLRDVVYDTNIGVNFLGNACLARRDPRFVKFLDDLLLRLPEHLVARLLAGWLHEGPARDSHWKKLAEAVSSSAEGPFRKYLDSGHPAMCVFEKWQEAQS